MKHRNEINDSMGKAKGALNREERSLRRQALIHEDISHLTSLLPTTNISSRGTYSGSNFRRTDPHVTVVELKTGTLYLYRGQQRRAEYVWRV
jgi:hypothetical protein